MQKKRKFRSVVQQNPRNDNNSNRGQHYKSVEERKPTLLFYQDQLQSLSAELNEQKERERQQLAMELHDNLGQLLSACKMKVDLLSNESLPVEIVKEIEEVRERMNDALAFTQNLMSELKPPPALREDNLTSSIRWLAKKMEKHGLEVIISDEDEPKQVSNRLQIALLQCVRELLFNVVAHTEVKEAFVNITCFDRLILISVEDRGPGFDPVAVNTAPADTGGLGLFNVQERMKFYGGNTQITTKPGEGTKITLCAPI